MMRRVETLLVSLVAMLGSASAADAATVVNGDFETGDLSGWTVDSTSVPGNGYWFAYTGTVAPLTGGPLGSTIAAPPEGTHAAVSDEVSPGRHLLYQDVALESLPAGGTMTLKLWGYYKAQQGALGNPTPDSLDPSAPGVNEQYRIDVMKPSAAIDSIDPADVLLNVFRTQAGDPQTLAPTEMTADLTPFAGQTVRLRFAETDNNGVLNASKDDVRIETVTPDPTIHFGKPVRDREKGTARLPVLVNGPGTVEISGKSIGAKTVQVANSGTFDLPVRPVGVLRSRIRRQRQGMANVTVRFDAATGKTATKDRRVHLRNKRH
jgi:hypothetical protein